MVYGHQGSKRKQLFVAGCLLIHTTFQSLTLNCQFTAQMTCSGCFTGQLTLALPCFSHILFAGHLLVTHAAYMHALDTHFYNVLFLLAYDLSCTASLLLNWKRGWAAMHWH